MARSQKSDKKADKVVAKIDKKAEGNKKNPASAPQKPKSSKEILASAKKSKSKSSKAKQDSDSDDSEESSESEVEPAPKVKKNKTTAPVKKSAPPPTNDSDEDSSDDSSEDEKPKAVQVKPSTKVAAASSSSEESSDESDAKPTKSTSAKAAVSSPAQKKKNSNKAKAPSSDSSSEDESSDDNAKKTQKAPVANGKAAAAKVVKPVVKTDTSSSEDSNEDSDSDSEEAGGATTASAKKPDPKQSSDSSDDSSDDDDVEMADTPATVQTNGKRKADADTEAPAKKVKFTSSEVTADGEPPSKTIFVGSLSWNVDNDWLAQEFAECGEVISARVQMDRNTGKSRGFGYVEFATVEAADAAVALEGKEIDGRAVNIDKSRPPAADKRAKAFGDTPSEPSATLFVGNVSFDSTEDSLWEAFAEFGEVKGVRLPTDRETQQPKGFAYVEFTDVEAAKKAFKGAQGLELGGRSVRLDFSQPRSNDDGDRRGGRGGGFGGGRGGFGNRGRGGFGGDRGGFGGRGGGRGRGGDRGGRGRGGDRGGRGGRGGSRTGGAVAFEGKKMTFN